MSNNTLIDTLRQRRTQYSLGKRLPVTKERVESVIKDAVRLSPSAFNSQSSRIVILFGAESGKLWNIAKDALRKIVPADAFAQTEARLDGFASGAGTILFYEDQAVVKGLQENFQPYAEHFPAWSEHASGMAQFAVWSALAAINIGASLQHYNPLIDAEAAKTWGIPSDWKLRAQMPFGSNESPFPEKTYIEDSARFRVYG